MVTNGFPIADVLQRLREAAGSLRARTAGLPAGASEEVEHLESALELLEQHEEALHRVVGLTEEVAQEAQAQHLRYRELFEFAPDAYLVTDPGGIILQANHAASNLLQTRKEFLVDKPLGLFVDAPDRREFYARLYRLKHGGGNGKEWGVRLQPPKGAYRDVLLAVAPIRHEDDTATGFRWLLRDITARRQAERALGAEQDFVASLVDTAPIIILLLDAAGRIVRSNPYLCMLSGYDAEELHGQGWCSLLIAPPDRDEAWKMFHQALASETKEVGLHALVGRHGRRRAIAWSARAVTQPGAGMAVLLCGQDVTELQEAQEQALRAERLAAIGQMVAGLAHESRNALQRSQSCLSLLGLRLRGQEEPLGLLERLQKAQDDLARIFESVRSYAAPIRLQSCACNLADAWRQAWADLAGLHERRNVELCEETSEVDLSLVGDPFRLKMLFRNLFENSLAAAGDPLRIVLSCSRVSVEGKELLQIAVRDNGPGFPAEQRHKLFEPFHTTKVTGTGLGLAICRRIVEAHGGRIAAGQSETPGAEIIITLPKGNP